MDDHRSYSEITKNDLNEIALLCKNRIEEYFKSENGEKWNNIYDYTKPICIALCQGAAMHHHDKTNGIKDFDIWFFYTFNKKHLPYRTIWNVDYENKKHGHNPDNKEYKGRKVDIIIRSIKNYVENDPIGSIYTYFDKEKTNTSLMLQKKAVVLIEPTKYMVKVIWYKNKKIE